LKWFKHFTKAHEDRAVETLIMEYGVNGYGLYFYCLEIIAGTISADNLTYELEPDAAILARRLSMDTVLVEKIMHRCLELGLFEISDNGRLTCLKIAKFFDSSQFSNPEMRKIFAKSIQGEKSHDSIKVSHDPIMIHPDQIRLDETRREEKKENTIAVAKAPAVIDELETKVYNLFLKVNGEHFANYPAQRKAVKALLKYARSVYPQDPGGWVWEYLQLYREKIKGIDKLWNKRTLLPTDCASSWAIEHLAAEMREPKVREDREELPF